MLYKIVLDNDFHHKTMKKHLFNFNVSKLYGRDIYEKIMEEIYSVISDIFPYCKYYDASYLNRYKSCIFQIYTIDDEYTDILIKINKIKPNLEKIKEKYKDKEYTKYCYKFDYKLEDEIIKYMENKSLDFYFKDLLDGFNVYIYSTDSEKKHLSFLMLKAKKIEIIEY